MRTGVVWLAVVLSACGVRSPLDPFPEGDGSVARPDGSAGRDAGEARPDAGAPVGRCALEEERIIATGDELRLPAVDRGSGRILVVYTDTGRGGSELHRILLRPSGEIAIDSMPLSSGEGGSLDFIEEFGAYSLFAHDGSELINGTLGADGGLLMPMEMTGVMSDSRRPALAINERIFGLAWNQGLSTVGVFGTVGGPDPEPVFFPGRDPHAVASPREPERVRLTTIEGNLLLLHSVFAPAPMGAETREEMLGVTEVLAARPVADDTDDGFAAVGFEDDAVVSWSVDGRRDTRRYPAEQAIDLAVARDDAGLTVIVTSHVENTFEDPPVVHVRAHVVSSGATEVLELPTSRGALPQPAIIWTGEPGRFLIVWDRSGFDFTRELVVTPIACRGR